MSNEMMDLRSRVETSADAYLLPETSGFAAKKLMELDLGAAFAEKSACRLARRNDAFDRGLGDKCGDRLPSHLEPLVSQRLHTANGRVG